MNGSAIRLFQVAAYGWLAIYMIAMLFLGTAAWTNAPVDLFTTQSSLADFVQRRIDLLAEGNVIHLCIAALLIALAQLRRHRWWLGLIAWLLFRIITHRTWLASNGGIQLMENMLLWAAFVGTRSHGHMTTWSHAHMSLFAFWAARLQLLLAYAAAAAHKFTGTSWLDGTAMLRVVNDPLFHLGWLADFPRVCAMLTWLTLAWMSLFPFAVWWKWSRRVVLIIGVFFHLVTAIFMDIPQLGLAFIACYALWLKEEEAERVLGWFRAIVPKKEAPRPSA